jgi:hypothetical protein
MAGQKVGAMITKLRSPALWLWLALSALLTYLSWDHVVNRGGWDPDDQLRLVQLRDFLGGQPWFDNSQHRLNGLDGAPMHWSRLIELPLALVIIITQPLFGQPVAEMIAGALVPLSCFGLVAFMLACVAERIGGRSAGLVAVVMTMVSPAISMQLRPMRIDHHGWQLVCAALSLWTLFWPSARNAGIAMGLALAVWLHISLEGAPATAAFFGFLGWRWIMDRAEGERLSWTVGSFAIGSLAMFLGTQSAGFAAPNYCDTVSPAHITAIGVAAAIILPAARWLPDNSVLRLALVTLAGFAAGMMLLLAAPVCGKGAFATLDPLVRDYWYVRVSEGMPVWHQKWTIAASLLGVPLAGVAAWFALSNREGAPQRSALAITTVLLVYTLLLALVVFRAISVATLIAVPLVSAWIAILFSRYRSEANALRRIATIALMILLLMPGIFIAQAATLFSPSTVAAEKAAERESAERCESIESVAALGALKNANIVAPFDIGPAILLTTPHRVLASSHHRNSQGMRDHIDIFRLPPAQSYPIVKRRQITHIISCSDEMEMKGYVKRNPEGLWAQLAKRNAPEWLVPMPDMGEGLKVWKVGKP